MTEALSTDEIASRYLALLQTVEQAREAVHPGRQDQSWQQGRGRHAAPVERTSRLGQLARKMPGVGFGLAGLAAPFVVLGSTTLPVVGIAALPLASRINHHNQRRIFEMARHSSDPVARQFAQSGFGLVKKSKVRAIQSLCFAALQAAAGVAFIAGGAATLPLAGVAVATIAAVTSVGMAGTALGSLRATAQAERLVRHLGGSSGHKVNLSLREIRDRAPERNALAQTHERRLRLYENALIERLDPKVADSVTKGLLSLERIATAITENGAAATPATNGKAFARTDTGITR